MKPLSWKTTVCGIITALAGWVAFSPEIFQHWPWVISLAKYIMIGGFAGSGILSKDYSQHSTQAEVTQATVDKSAALNAAATKAANEGGK